MVTVGMWFQTGKYNTQCLGTKENRLNKTHNTYNINAIDWENFETLYPKNLDFQDKGFIQIFFTT